MAISERFSRAAKRFSFVVVLLSARALTCPRLASTVPFPAWVFKTLTSCSRDCSLAESEFSSADCKKVKVSKCIFHVGRREDKTGDRSLAILYSGGLFRTVVRHGDSTFYISRFVKESNSLASVLT